jgi:hypothetical protein
MIEYKIKKYQVYAKIEFVEKHYYKVAKIKYCIGPAKNIEKISENQVSKLEVIVTGLGKSKTERKIKRLIAQQLS